MEDHGARHTQGLLACLSSLNHLECADEIAEHVIPHDLEVDIVSTYSNATADDPFQCMVAIPSKPQKVSNLKIPPTSQREAYKRPDVQMWKDAEVEEMASLERKEVFQTVTKPTGTHLVGVKWVYTFKHDEMGNIVVKRHSRCITKSNRKVKSSQHT
ncbi:hypothetical protein PQX77_011271, partial [Marasmius sp. AFHP31]